MKRVAIVFVLFVGISAAPARAENSMPGACPKPGTVLATSLNTTLIAVSASGLTCNMRVKGTGAEFSMIGLLLRRDEKRTPADDGIAAVSSLWPLEAGKSAKYQLHSSTDSSHWDEQYSVGPKQSVTTQAGTFQAFPVTQEESGSTHGAATNGFRGTYTYYIAPELGYVVKFSFSMTGGSPKNNPREWELVSVKSH